MFVRQNYNYTFTDWLKSPIETINGIVYDVEQDSIPLTHRDFVNTVYNDIMETVHKHGHTITYKKAFKIKLAKILYSLSDNSNYGI